ncbi:YgiW/YdeI family stress tolerance OB fold protein [Desulfovibrio cuneatus]|uniref:YgiW/YdeI family stress tolerance OB fold protein n=1 Tax=Desulfovibrio cuneatus TaxID=159728 RepID=UPI000489F93B|nr:NirD/YgiW/YdeI family stress tolerance protein [Desulfovibrio cuneatus]
MKKSLFIMALFVCFLSTPALARFTGPSVGGPTQTVAQAQNVRTGTYISLTGNIIEHLRENYFTFRDATGSIRVEIENDVWQGRDVSPQQRITIFGEVDTDRRGRYIWVKSLTVSK